MKNKNVLFTTQAAMIAALYVVLTFLAAATGLSSGVIQIRFSEALTVLPYFTGAAVPGLFIGCLLSNLLTGCTLVDIIFGSLTTLAAACLSYRLRRFKYAVMAPPVVLNALIIPFILRYGYGLTDESIPYMMLTVGTGEFLSCGIFGGVLLLVLSKYSGRIFTAAGSSS